MVENDGSEPKASVLFGKREVLQVLRRESLNVVNGCVLDHRGNFCCSFYDQQLKGDCSQKEISLFLYGERETMLQ